MDNNVKMNIQEKIGERKVMKCGEECEIVEYRKYSDITVKFLKTGELVKSKYGDFKKEKIKSHFTPSVFGVGIIGYEKTRKDGVKLRSYDTWRDMLKRCYSEKYQQMQPTYKGCSVCDEWLYYSNFKKWYEDNYYEIEGQRMCLDKDIINKGNRIYSPNNCIFVPNNINLLFVKCDSSRGNLPIGVSLNKSQKYDSKCRIFDVSKLKHCKKYLGYFNTPKEAFDKYKVVKEENIKQIADYYKDRIPEKLYNAMYKYEVHIHD